MPAKRARNVRETCVMPCAKHAKRARNTSRNTRNTPRNTPRNTTSHTVSPPSGPRISLRLHFEASKVPLQPPQNDYHPLSSIFCQFQPLGTQSRPPTDPPTPPKPIAPPHVDGAKQRETCAKRALCTARNTRNVRETPRETRETPRETPRPTRHILAAHRGPKKNDNFTMENHYALTERDTTPSGWAGCAAQRPHTPSPSALQHVR